MKDHNIKVLDEDDHVFIETLTTLGMPRTVATTMAYLMNVNKAPSREIEISTGLRQPEISLAMTLMRKNAWVSTSSEKKPGKGRPVKIYSLATTMDKILSFYEDKVYEESQTSVMAIEKIRAINKNRQKSK